MGLPLRLAWRNLARRRAQTAVILAGLLLGAAVITASLTVADSLRHGIRQAAFDAYGPADEFVQVDGQLFVPDDAAKALASDADLARASRAVSPVVLGQVALRDARTHARVSATGLEGFDAKADAPFGLFHLDGQVSDGAALKDGEAYLAQDVADALGARVGDTLNVSAQAALEPSQYASVYIEGNITGAGTCTDPKLVPPGVPTLPGPLTCPTTPDSPVYNSSTVVQVARGARSLSIVAETSGSENDPRKPDLDIVVTSPGGNRTVDAAGVPGAPSDPAYLNVLPVKGRYLEQGNWTVRITTKAAADWRWTGAIYVEYAVYDLASATGRPDAGDLLGDPDAAFYAGSNNVNVHSEALTVKGIVAKEGKGASLGRTGVFVTTATAQKLFEKPGMVNAVKLSNTGDVEDGWTRDAPATRAATRVLDALRAANPDEPAYDHLHVAPVKAQALRNADTESRFYREFLTAVSTLTVLAGVLLVVNVFTLLASERRRELGTARAIGFTRGALVRAFAWEAVLLGAAASVAGVLLGLAGSLGILLGFDFILSQVNAGIGSFAFHPEPASLVLALVLSFLLIVATACIAAWRISGLTIAQAQRGLEDPPHANRKGALLAGAAALGFGVACALGAFATTGQAAFALSVAAPPLLILGLARFAAPRPVPTRIAFPVAGLLMALAASASIFLQRASDDALGRVLSLLRGVVIALGLVLALVHSPGFERMLDRALGRIKPLKPVARLAVRYPLRRRGRTGLTVAMLAFVMMVLTFFSILGTTFALHLEDETGGYDVLATSTAPAADLRAVAPVTARMADPLRNATAFEPLLGSDAFGGNLVTLDGARVHYKGAPVDHVYSYRRTFAQAAPFSFAQLDPKYPNGSAAMLAVMQDPSLVIIGMGYTLDETGNPGAHHVGSTLVLHGANGNTTLRVIGVLKEYYLGGIWVHPVVHRTSFQDVHGVFLVKAKPGFDPDELVRQLDAAGETNGVDAVNLQTQAAAALEENEQFLRMFQMFLGFGLLVGVASLVVVMTREALARQRDIGVLRAMGHDAELVLAWFAAESLLVTLVGSLVGVVAGTILAFGTWWTTIRPVMLVPFGFSYIVLPVILLLVLGTALVAAAWPSWSAARTPPAEAVRAD